MEKDIIISMKYLLSICLIFCYITGIAQNYTPLDNNDPVYFKGDRIIYQGQEIILNEKSLYVDGQLSDEDIKRHPYVYNTFNEAVKHLIPGTEDEPMTIYIAPYVYWVDNPDDPNVRYPLPGQRAPFALVVGCPWLKLYGLTQKPENVVLAVNRGQSQGSYGNFTLMDYHGDGLHLYNMTIGNYCNIDLVYPLNPKFNRKRRMDAITQAQLIFAHGDKNEAHNVHFLSRLNLNPIFGAKRTLFHKCYFEMTDDSLCKSGVYLDCILTFYGSMPFGNTQPIGGAVFLNCDFYVKTKDYQYLVKTNRGPVTLIDTRYHCDHPIYIGWNQDPIIERCFYQSNVTLNGKPFLLEPNMPEVTVDISKDPLLDAYKVTYNDSVIYNTYNLLAGNDDWDPMGVKPQILAAEKKLGRKLKEIPVHLGIYSSIDTLETGKVGREIYAIARRHSDFDATIPNLKWDYDHTLLSLEGDNSRKIIRSINNSDSTYTTVICLTSDLGLKAAKKITVKPSTLPAPKFKKSPKLLLKNKKLSLDYVLDNPKYADESVITWYRFSDENQISPIPVKISRFNIPATDYKLTLNDVGYNIMAEIAPKHMRSNYGKKIQIIWDEEITEEQVDNQYYFYTDFVNFPESQQTKIIPGFWTVDGYKPLDTAYYTDWKADSIRNWYYGNGINGARGYEGFLQATKGARLMFTPIQNKKYGNMSVELTVAPCKQGAQGFGSATGQYLDICLKFDTRTLTGYALRVIRTTKYHDAVDFYLIKYTNGKTKQISNAITGICYLPKCTLHIETQGNKLFAHVETTAKMRETSNSDLHKSIDLSAVMDEVTDWGGFAIQHTGSGRGNSTLLHSLKIDWK